MNERGIGTGVHYLSVPEHPYYQQRFGWCPDNYPNAKRIGRQTVSLPFSARISGEEATRVVESVQQILLRHQVSHCLRLAA